ncbi:hypothetical protein ZHAS_00009620 [Anopheles sinensis]|uniref:Uncharacterized protein n=1 Tax=Anopheles sinensis TaxID=74873 RepID=A0A084VVP5_ANOSI|nr:hypothetical protein ZHAS_00009620 [Anopheles sinensis]
MSRRRCRRCAGNGGDRFLSSLLGPPLAEPPAPANPSRSGGLSWWLRACHAVHRLHGIEVIRIHRPVLPGGTTPTNKTTNRYPTATAASVSC